MVRCMNIANFNLGIVDVVTIIGVLSSMVVSIYGLQVSRAMKKREQASQIWAWVDRSKSDQHAYDVVLSNDGGGLVYNVVATVVRMHESGAEQGKKLEGEQLDKRVTLPVLKPGERRFKVGYLDYSMHKYFGVEIGFVDKFGVSWIKTADGKLKRLRWKKGIFDYYGIARPPEWTSRI